VSMNKKHFSDHELHDIFFITAIKVMEMIRIIIETEHISTCQVDIYKFFFSILNINMTLFWDFEYKNRIPEH
jgi:hypothetical protein